MEIGVAVVSSASAAMAGEGSQVEGGWEGVRRMWCVVCSWLPFIGDEWERPAMDLYQPIMVATFAVMIEGGGELRGSMMVMGYGGLMAG